MRKHFKILLRVLGYALVFLLCANIGFLIVAFVLYTLGVREYPQITGEFISDLAVLPIIIIIFRFYKKEKFNELLQERIQISKILKLIPISILSRVLLLIGIVLFMALVQIFLGKDFGNLLDRGLSYQWEAFSKAKSWDFIFGFLSFVVFGPINEELLNRGIILNYLIKHYSIRTSIIYSSLFFMLLHIHPGLYLSSFILGLILAYVYTKWKNIWYSIILHMLINLHPFLIGYFFGK